MDRIDVRGAQTGRQTIRREPGPTAPASARALDREVDRDLVRDDMPSAFEREREMVAVGTELELEVAIAVAEQEELDDLVIPESVAAAYGRRGRRIPVVRRLDLDLDRAARTAIETKLDACALVFRERPAVPGGTNLESISLHAYPPAEGARDLGDRVKTDAASAHRDRGWLDGSDTQVLPAPVRAAFRELEGELALRSLSGGLLHQSFHVRAGAVEYVLQRVSDVFAPAIHDNIEAVTRHLAAKGLRVARLLRTRTGALSADLGALGRWRLMNHLGGVSFDQVESVAQARSAGALVGRFHAALADFDAPLAPMGIPFHDTPRYLAALRQALVDHPDHRLYAQTREVAERIFSAFESMGSPPRAPTRVIHGDLKLSNLLFEAETLPGRDVAFALVDFDTLMRGTLWMELGDLWRSWCNSVGEDSTSPRFDLEIFAASCDGFARGFGASLDPVEIDSLAEAPERIILELASRFAADALEETYWGWDPERFPARGEHDIHRAVGQWRLYEAARATRSRRRELLRRLG